MVKDDGALVTTVIPTYRRPTSLQRAIESAAGQAHVDVLVSVFDNASGDDTSSVIERMQARFPQISYHCHAENMGAAANFDFGLRSVTTPYFSILSDDDYLLPEFYERALAGLTAHPDAMFWAGVTINADIEGVIWDAKVARWAREGIFAPPEGVLAMTGGMAPTWTGIVFRREILLEAGLPDPELRGPSDLEFCLRLAARYPYIVEKHPSAVFTLNPDSFSATQPLSSFWPGWIQMFDKVENYTTLDPVTRRELLESLRNDGKKMLFRRGVNALSACRLDYAREAAHELENFYKKRVAATALIAMAWACEFLPGVQKLLTQTYKYFEGRIVASRKDLQVRYGELIRK